MGHFWVDLYNLFNSFIQVSTLLTELTRFNLIISRLTLLDKRFKQVGVRLQDFECLCLEFSLLHKNS